MFRCGRIRCPDSGRCNLKYVPRVRISPLEHEEQFWSLQKRTIEQGLDVVDPAGYLELRIGPNTRLLPELAMTFSRSRTSIVATFRAFPERVQPEDELTLIDIGWSSLRLEIDSSENYFE